jgi:serine protease AprX
MNKKLISLLLTVILIIGSVTGAIANSPEQAFDTSLKLTEEGISKEELSKMELPDKKVTDQQQRPTEHPILTDANNNKIFDNLEQDLQRADAAERFNVIVMFSDKVDKTKKQMVTEKVGAYSPTFEYEHAFQGFAATLTKKQIEAFQSIPFVKQIEMDMPVQAFMNTASSSFGVTKARNDFGLSGNSDGSLSSYSKNDVVVAVIDTGIDGSHVDLDGGKVIGWRDFVNGRSTAYDDNGHGTHVAGISSGSGDGNSNYRGAAYGSALVGIKVLDRNGSGSFSTITAGIDWAIQNKSTYGINIINLSLGSSASSDGTDSASTAVNNAANNGIVPLVAAGNSGPARYTIGSPGAAEKAITVGAMADVGEMGFNIASFSSRGPTKDGRTKPDIVSPGVRITAADANTGSGYVALSGTSMATPFTAGVVALMLQANGGLSPAQIKSILMNTAQDWGPSGKDIDFGAGRLQAYEAIKSAGGYSGTGPNVPNHGHGSGNLSGRGDADNWSLGVSSTAYPVSTTLIMKDWSNGSPDFDLYVYDPNGNLVGKSEGTTRQETVTFNPTVTGTYQIRAYSYSGSGAYELDVSYK